jgi:ABC-type lipoprotein export system ATPase subunit
MNFKLEKLIPLPMVEIPTEGSSIWEADSFIFEQGKKYLVEAASGKGKTSLLSIMYGLRKDYSGMLYLDEMNVASFKLRQWSLLRKEKLSYIFQGLELFNEQSALDNILLKNKITSFKTRNEIITMAERLDVAMFLNNKCGILSFGQNQRIAIIRALCQPFQFLFADECFSHIDGENSQAAMKLISEECEKQNAGLILTSLGTSQYQFDYHITI